MSAMKATRDELDDYASQHYPSVEKLRSIDKKKKGKTGGEDRSSQQEGAESKLDHQESEEPAFSASASKADITGDKSGNKSANAASFGRLDSAISGQKSRISYQFDVKPSHDSALDVTA